MPSTTITIPVDADCAKAYESASEQQRRKIEMLLRLRLHEIVTAPSKPLTQLMDEIGAEAKANGLTPEILDEILNDKDARGD